MARQSIINREAKRAKLALRYKAKRDALKKVIHDTNASGEERDTALADIQKIPRNASPVRKRNRCRASVSCLNRVYNNRIYYLEGFYN